MLRQIVTFTYIHRNEFEADCQLWKNLNKLTLDWINDEEDNSELTILNVWHQFVNYVLHGAIMATT